MDNKDFDLELDEIMSLIGYSDDTVSAGAPKETKAEAPKPQAPQPAREEPPVRPARREPEQTSAQRPARREPEQTSAQRPARRETEPAPEKRPVRTARREPEPVSRKEEPEQNPPKKGLDAARSTPFFIMLALVTVLAWMLPLRPTVSESEKRELKSFPEFSTSALFDGSFFAAIDDWFSDSFTFREDWISSYNRFEDLYGIKDVAIIEMPGGTGGDEPGTPAVTEEPEGDNPYIDPAPTPPAVEPDPAEVTPQPTPEPTPEPDPNYIEAPEDEFKANGKLLLVKNSAFKYTGYSEYNCNQLVEICNRLGDTLKGKANLYLSVVPENATSMLKRKDRERYGFGIEEDAFDLIYSGLNENVTGVNVIPNLVRHNDEYIVFRTDHHWTALGAYYAYESWCEAAGVEPVPLSEYEEIELPGFLGTYFYTSGESKQLGDTPDTVYAYNPPGNIEMYNNYSSGDGLGAKEDYLLLDMSKSQPGRKYMTFIGTDEARTTFINNDITDGSAVMIIKTSFGNPYVYYFTQHYQYVYCVDYRYYNGRCISSFVDEFDVDDVIISGGLGYVADNGGLNILRAYCK